jgi:hypothetical protein
VIHESLKTLNEESYVFITSGGDSYKDVHYQLADQAILHYLLDHNETDNDNVQHFTKIFISVVALSKRFAESSTLLISEVVKRLGFKFTEEDPDALTPA